MAALGAGDAQVPNGADVVPPKLKSSTWRRLLHALEENLTAAGLR